MILKCKCKNEYQDEKHGKQNRVFNEMLREKQSNPQEYRCTVCGNVKTEKG